MLRRSPPPCTACGTSQAGVEETNPLRVAANVAAIQPAVGGGAVVAAPAIAASRWR